jgi:hypothetical protein
MSYQILTDDDAAYQRAIEYVRKRCPDDLRIESPRYRMIAVEELTNEAKEHLRKLGAHVVIDRRYALEAG